MLHKYHTFVTLIERRKIVVTMDDYTTDSIFSYEGMGIKLSVVGILLLTNLQKLV